MRTNSSLLLLEDQTSIIRSIRLYKVLVNRFNRWWRLTNKAQSQSINRFCIPSVWRDQESIPVILASFTLLLIVPMEPPVILPLIGGGNQ
ncbi:hypothetical protein HanHA300_Chr16g0626701 [Helianthus annuus]|nr:hypothetical protein HanHA300_Chr16g0626701 [Helianthus annuus]